MNMDLEQIDFPIDYVTFTEERKNVILDKIIDASLVLIESALMFNPEINRMNFLLVSLGESLEQQEAQENYEVCALIKDLIDRINDC